MGWFFLKKLHEMFLLFHNSLFSQLGCSFTSWKSWERCWWSRCDGFCLRQADNARTDPAISAQCHRTLRLLEVLSPGVFSFWNPFRVLVTTSTASLAIVYDWHHPSKSFIGMERISKEYCGWKGSLVLPISGWSSLWDTPSPQRWVRRMTTRVTLSDHKIGFFSK